METVTVTRPGAPTGGDDEQGNPIIGSPTTIPVEAIAVAPLEPQESAELFGPENTGGYRLFLPTGSGLESTDTVTVRGEAGFQVWGDAGLVGWVSPFTSWAPGEVAVVRRAS